MVIFLSFGFVEGHDVPSVGGNYVGYKEVNCVLGVGLIIRAM